MSQARPGASRRIAILGGGIGALSTAWRLSTRPEYSITIYQRGWRLGGKAASSRGRHGRIEEHGLHVWLGYYDNAFRMIRECYQELDRPNADPKSPIPTWADAFRPADAVGLFVDDSGAWDEWMGVFARNDETPGEPTISSAPLSLLQVLSRARDLLQDFFRSLPDDGSNAPERIVISASPHPPQRSLPLATLLTKALDAAAAAALGLAQQSLSLADGLAGADPRVAVALTLLEDLQNRLSQYAVGNGPRRRTMALVDVVVTTIRGVLADGLLIHPRGFAAANGEDYRSWLTRHGAAVQTLDSPLIRGVYDLVFGFRNGDPDRPEFEAGTGLFLSWKIFFEYKGSIFWKMQAGMGDVVFAPLYQALRARGVRFEFFHEVDELVVSEDGFTIDSIRLVRQTTLADGVDEYQPLADFGGLPCFPAEPDQTQVAAPVLELVDTEKLWGRPQRSTCVELQCGVDYDDIVFGLSIGMVRHTCRQLMEQNRAWRDMAQKLGTVATQSAQLWLRSGEQELGWSHSGATLTGYVKPFDTASSMSHLLSMENWPEDERPASIIYLCSTLPDDGPPHNADIGYLRDQHDRVGRHVHAFLGCDAIQLLPHAYANNGFDWAELIGAGDAVGPTRLESQFWSANVDPSDRYVQSLPGTDRFRLRPDRSGYSNLFLSGDWTDCGLNAGCIEAAVISGLQAANAVTGDDRWSGISGDWKPLVGIR